MLGGLREAGPGASGLRGVGAAFGRRTVGREGRHCGLNAERQRLRVRPEAQRRQGRGALRELAAAPAPLAPRGGRKAPNWAAGTVAAEPRWNPEPRLGAAAHRAGTQGPASPPALLGRKSSLECGCKESM